MTAHPDAFIISQWCSENISPIQEQIPYAGTGLKFVGKGWEISAVLDSIECYIEDDTMKTFFYLKFCNADS